MLLSDSLMTLVISSQSKGNNRLLPHYCHIASRQCSSPYQLQKSWFGPEQPAASTVKLLNLFEKTLFIFIWWDNEGVYYIVNC